MTWSVRSQDYASLGAEDDDDEIDWINSDGELLSPSELLEYCVWPTLSSTAPHLLSLLSVALIFTLTTRTGQWHRY